MNKNIMKKLHVTGHLKGMGFVLISIVFISLGLNGMLGGMEPTFLVAGILAACVGGLNMLRAFDENRDLMQGK